MFEGENRVDGELGRLSNDSNGFKSLPVCDWKSRVTLVSRFSFCGNHSIGTCYSSGSLAYRM